MRKVLVCRFSAGSSGGAEPQCRLGMWQKSAARLGESDTAMQGLVQRDPEFVLEEVDAAADGGLRSMHPLGRPRKSAEFGDCEEGFELVDVHGSAFLMRSRDSIHSATHMIRPRCPKGPDPGDTRTASSVNAIVRRIVARSARCGGIQPYAAGDAACRIGVPGDRAHLRPDHHGGHAGDTHVGDCARQMNSGAPGGLASRCPVLAVGYALFLALALERAAPSHRGGHHWACATAILSAARTGECPSALCWLACGVGAVARLMARPWRRHTRRCLGRRNEHERPDRLYRRQSVSRDLGDTTTLRGG
jgi:hypothetical protein